MTELSDARPITGERTVLPVLDHRHRSDGLRWLKVLLPGRPNSHTGWIQQRATTPSFTHWQLTVSLSARTVTVFYAGHVVTTFSAVVGKPTTPTPTGSFFVEENVTLTPEQSGAPYALALSARSNALARVRRRPRPDRAPRHREHRRHPGHRRLPRMRTPRHRRTSPGSQPASPPAFPSRSSSERRPTPGTRREPVITPAASLALASVPPSSCPRSPSRSASHPNWWFASTVSAASCLVRPTSAICSTRRSSAASERRLESPERRSSVRER